MAGRGISGLAVAEIGAGLILAWAGIENVPVSAAVGALVRGQAPPKGPPQQLLAAPAASAGGPLTGAAAAAVNPSPPNAATVAAYKAFAMSLLALHGWPGQFSALDGIVMGESSWNPLAHNPSGAYGIAQALGHGQGAATAAPDGINEYGNFGTPDSICQLANEGHGDAQLIWMLNYIGQVYGDPNAAWAHHQAVGTY